MSLNSSANKAFDALDQRNYGLAERIIEPAIAEAPTDPALRAALALLQYAKKDDDEAIDTALSLAADNPSEPRTVMAMIHVLQQTSQWQAVVDTYQRVIPLLSRNGTPDRSAMENLALTYARMHRYADVQKECAKLAKDTGDVKYVLWGAMANLLVAPENDPNSLLLKLVARVVDKSILDAKPEQLKVTPEHCAMYLEALERQHAYKDALAFVASARFRALGPLDRLQTYARIARLAGQVSDAAAVSRHLWQSEPENWTYFEAFVEVLDAARDTAKVSDEQLRQPVTISLSGCDPLTTQALRDGESTALDVANAFAQQLGKEPRGLSLCRFELLQRAGDHAQLQAAVVKFCEQHSTRPSCFLDVAKYVQTNGDAAWLDALRNGGKDADVGADWTLADHSSSCVRLQLIGLIRKDIPESDDKTLTYLKEVLAALRACPLAAERGDSAHPWPQLLATALNAVGRRLHHVPTPAEKRRWAAVGVRVAALGPARHLFPTVHLFALLFARTLGYDDVPAVDALDFKSVQLDSMAYLSLEPLRESHDMVRAFHYATMANLWYERFESETSSLMAKAFHNAAWSQIRQLRRFQSAVANSVSRAEWHALYAALATLSSENRATLLAGLRKLRNLVDVLAVDPEAAVVNDDRKSVAAAALQECPGSPYQTALLVSLMPETSTPVERARNAHGLCAFFLILRDLAAYVTSATAPKPSASSSKKNKSKGAAPAAAAAPRPAYLMDRAINGRSLEDRVAAYHGPSKATMAAIVRVARAVITNDAVPAAEREALSAEVQAFAASATSGDATALRGLMWPAVPVVVCALRLLSPVAAKLELPVRDWAASLVTALERAEATARAAAAQPPAADGEAALPIDFDATALGLDGSECVSALPTLRQSVFTNLATNFKAAAVELTGVKNLK